MATEHTDDTVGKFFDTCARQGMLEGFSSEEQAKIDAVMAEWNLESGMRVLEPGCGTGRLTKLLADAVGPTGVVFAFDISGNMIRRAIRRGLPSQATFHRCSVFALPVRDGFFDSVVAFHVFPHFNDPEAALKELHRVLKPGGTLRIVHLKNREHLNEFHREGSRANISRELPQDDMMRELFNAAGFDTISICDDANGYRAYATRR